MPYKDKEAQRAFGRRRVSERRAKYMQGASCARCGSTDRLELDHIDPTQKTEHRIWSWSDDRIQAEMAKCQWLCKPCHIAKTIEDRPVTQPVDPYEHGTRRMYTTKGCRCLECRRANTAYRQALRTR